MAWAYRKNARHSNPKKNAIRKAIPMLQDGCQQVEGQSKESRSLEAYCRGGQGPPRAVELFGRMEYD